MADVTRSDPAPEPGPDAETPTDPAPMPGTERPWVRRLVRGLLILLGIVLVLVLLGLLFSPRDWRF